jgi:hypothetical protein
MSFRNGCFSIKILFSLIFCCLISIVTIAQQNSFNFSPLSSDFYKEKIGQLEKYTVPKYYSDKSSQAWYDEIMNDKNKSLLTMFKDNDIVYDTLLLNKCNSILKRIAAANSRYNFDSIKLYINRSVIANAACWGEGTIMVNLGLFLWIDNDNELALVLGHEIAHQLLNHAKSKMEKSIAMLTSDDFKDELKKIKKADYGKYDRFRNLMKGLQVESGKHSRYKESEADSIGALFARNAGYDINIGSRILLKLDNVDDLFSSNKLYVLKNLLANTQVNLSYFISKRKYSGLSSVEITMNADKDLDSIKTHPDCKNRYVAINGKDSDLLNLNCCMELNSNFQQYKERAMLELVRYEYEKNALGLCAHLCFFALKNDYIASIYNNFLSLCFSRLYYNDKHLQRFESTNTFAIRNSNIKEIQDYLFQVSSADLDTLSLYFFHQNSATSTEDYEFTKMMYETMVKQTDTSSAYLNFNKKFPDNKYQYLIQKKKE